MKIIEEQNRIVAIDEEKQQEVGKLTFTRMGEELASFDHTFVNPVCRGQNIAEQLLLKAADVMRSEHRKVIPRCSYVAVKFERDPRYSDIDNTSSKE